MKEKLIQSSDPELFIRKKKVGIMGGTFDPIHIGHLILAEQAYHQFNLERVLFMPSGHPPHKKMGADRASVKQRVEMTRLAIEDNPHFALSLEEAGDMGYTFTYRTLERMNNKNPDTEYYFIIGADSLFAFHTWMHPEQICRQCVLLVAVRDNLNSQSIDERIWQISSAMNAQIIKLNTENINVSSEMLRQRLAMDIPVKYYIPDKVITYIRKEELYKIV